MNQEERKEYNKAYRQANADKIRIEKLAYYYRTGRTLAARLKRSQDNKARRKKKIAEKYAHEPNQNARE